MAERVEMVRPTELWWKSPVLFTLSPRSRSEPGALSEDIMGVLSSAGEEGACKHVLRDCTRGFISVLWCLTPMAIRRSLCRQQRCDLRKAKPTLEPTAAADYICGQLSWTRHGRRQCEE